ncbi:hypothetical protein [Halorubrum halophilum]|uniref:hypothetical protein n=1 Tax=Halorubrum halophilum TaxID=413816 RepID=UPI0012AB9574|nr:hypothetical protein [Halorubrum halophilum]
MYWNDAELGEVVRYLAEGSAEELGSPIKFIAQGDIQSGSVPEEISEEFIENDFDYAPIRPYKSQQYYDVSAQEIKELDQKQCIGHDEIMLKCLNVLTEYPLAIVTHPDQECYGIVTPSNFNKRIAKEYLYTFFAATAQSISHVIESRYSTEEVLPTYLSNRNSGEAANRWAEARENNVELHVVEFMNLTDLKVIVTEIEEIREDMGFDSKTQCRQSFDAVSKFRDKVMHANRTMVSEPEDTEALAEAIDEASSLTKQAQDLNT